jgi:putative glutamine amidotransferase
MPQPNYVRPRVGVPWRTAAEEAAGRQPRLDLYLRAVTRAGAEPVLVSLQLPPDQLKRQAAELDAFVLPGSPADVDPSYFRGARHPAAAEADKARERTDFTLLEHALAADKPVLAICYGIQSLNVFFGGSLVQDITSELGSLVCHSPAAGNAAAGAVLEDVYHDAQFDEGLVRGMAGSPQTQVNSYHHQSVLEPGRGLRVTARAPDGVVEAVEWTSESPWIVGVQWHPERMPEDALAQALFSGVVSAAREGRAAR